MTQTILRTVDDGVGVITLNRPDRLNAMDSETGDQFEAVMAEMAADEAIRAIVITGTGDSGFCAGADADRLQDLAEDANPGSRLRAPGTPGPLDVVADSPKLARGRYSSPIVAPKPVIAAVNGACAGIGLSLAASCDIRFASRTAVFAAAFPRRGLTAEVALAWTLTRLVGHGAASDILLSGRKIGAEEALSMGLVNAVVEPAVLMDHTRAYARDIARNTSPRSARVIKRQLHLAAEQTYADAMQLSFEEVLSSLESEDFKEGVASFREKRAPRFVGR